MKILLVASVIIINSTPIYADTDMATSPEQAEITESITEEILESDITELTLLEITETETTTLETEITTPEEISKPIEDTELPETEEIIKEEILDLTEEEEIVSSDEVKPNIDGYFDDWEDKPHSDINYSWDTNNINHKASMHRDDEYIYLHIKMSENSYSGFVGSNYIFIVDGISIPVIITDENGSNEFQSGLNQLVVRDQNGYTLIDGSGGIMLRQDGSFSDEAEIRIPLSFFSDNPNTIKDIEFNSPNLGGQSIINTGTSTNPFLIVCIAFLIVIFSLAIIRRISFKYSDDKDIFKNAK